VNAKVITVFVLTLIALAILSLVSFGPWSKNRHAAQMNPASLTPTATQTAVPPSTTAQTATRQTATAQPTATQAAAIDAAPVALRSYSNRDVRENRYSLSIPESWQLTAGTTPGSYALHFDGGSGMVELRDVPDNTTLELFILSQEEPKLRRSTPGYERTGYRQLTIHGASAYELRYRGQALEVVRTYITGADNAAMLTFTTSGAPSDAALASFAAVCQSFRWEP
jgi:hypothetical protein